MILGLRTFIAHVRSEQLDAAKAWYTQFVGAPPYFDTPFYVGFNVGGFELGLHPEGEPGPGGVVAYWGTPDIATELARVVALGATVVKPIENVGEGIQVATLADPFGNPVGLIENPHFDPKAVR
ncbi:MAG: VOC family protein [Planctomycetia bacterium]|nr:VOC family protein [Planctomycetia bacterium]